MWFSKLTLLSALIYELWINLCNEDGSTIKASQRFLMAFEHEYLAIIRALIKIKRTNESRICLEAENGWQATHWISSAPSHINIGVISYPT